MHSKPSTRQAAPSATRYRLVYISRSGRIVHSTVVSGATPARAISRATYRQRTTFVVTPWAKAELLDSRGRVRATYAPLVGRTS